MTKFVKSRHPWNRKQDGTYRSKRKSPSVPTGPTLPSTQDEIYSKKMSDRINKLGEKDEL